MPIPVRPACVLMLVSTVLPMSSAAPRRAREDRKVFSQDHRYVLFSSVATHHTKVFRVGSIGSLEHPLWELPIYVPLPFLSNDGRHIASAYEGGNILASGTMPSDPLITFYRDDGSQTTVPVSAILPHLEALRSTSDGKVWGSFLGFNGPARFLLILENNQQITLNADSGKPVISKP